VLRRLFSPSLERVFSRIHRRNLWGANETVSGEGSTLARTKALRAELPRLLREIGAKSLLDASCGDFNWMRQIDLSGIDYTGVDIVAAIIQRNQKLYGSPYISFAVADITRDPLPRADAILCRDALDHLSLRRARRAIANFKSSGAQYLLATTHPAAENIDIRNGHWRPLDLTKPPFGLSVPVKTIVENPVRGKHLGLWRLGDR
jgi:SAM-dependent methyltransferase